MQWDDIRHFLALAREGSLSAAARRLGVEHTTVARRADAVREDEVAAFFASPWRREQHPLLG
ncbi:helix-turn-helix domain-containing protein, partial [Ralstonia pseudosolanacearum]|uniref:helix-turn-helix domain-containing protein n=1 Tax=Ralstonia pseudosolanacearum TaxID=1310165 RepID=UPI003CF94F5F